MALALTDRDREMAAGEHGRAPATAMRIITRVAEADQAARLIDVTSAHVDSCLYHGEAGLDFAERLAAAGGRVVVPTTLNVSSLDLLHPHLVHADERLVDRGRRMMAAYTAMGGTPTWTCAPYQTMHRPGLGEHVAWAESNAVVFANSVLGARTDRYGDFIDVCAALTGRVPEAGLHLDRNRRARALFRLIGIPDRLAASEVLYPVLGHLIGRQTGTRVPAITGLPSGVSEDSLKALGAAAASSGGVGMFHAVGTTPEAPTLEVALGGADPDMVIDVDVAALRVARDELTTDAAGTLTAVSVGTPHFSQEEFRALARLVAGGVVASGIEFYVNTSREVLAAAAAEGTVHSLRSAGIEIVTDTCTYITPILHTRGGVVMTNSGKWAWYAPANIGVQVAFGSLEDCVASAMTGRITRDEAVWGA
ncbi:MAG TPA: aconitase X catalytic domain-containing protein [Acidimicrobiia bacterium]